MAQIELKEGQVNFPVQDSPNTISEPGIIPVGSKLADISAIIAPNGYRPRCTVHSWRRSEAMVLCDGRPDARALIVLQ